MSIPRNDFRHIHDAAQKRARKWAKRLRDVAAGGWTNGIR